MAKFLTDLFSFSFVFGKPEQIEGGSLMDPTFTLAHLHSDCSFKWKRQGIELLLLPREL